MTKQKKVKLGFIGCGRHATANLYPVLPKIQEIDLISVCDIKEEIARRNAQNYGAKKWYRSYEEMIEKERLDAVAIVGDPRLHAKAGDYCLKRGLHIFVEKPPALNSHAVKKLLNTAKKYERFGQVAFMKRFSIGYRLAKQIVSEQFFGKVNSIEIKFANGPYPKLWGLESEAISFLIGQAIHMFDLLRFFCGDVASITAQKHELTSEKFSFGVIVEFKNGSIGIMNINSCQSWEKMDERVEITGDESFIVI